jgi:hypothetical protein
MSKQYTVREFIRLTPPQKQRLQKRDLKQYNELVQKMEKQFPKEDPDIAEVVNSNPKVR